MNKNERFLASQLNDIKARLNAELKRRAGEGSVFGLADEVYKAQINDLSFFSSLLSFLVIISTTTFFIYYIK